jgi:hypothetical protein
MTAAAQAADTGWDTGSLAPPTQKGSHPVTSQGTPADGPPPFDVSVAHSARMYDYWLGGCFL